MATQHVSVNIFSQAVVKKLGNECDCYFPLDVFFSVAAYSLKRDKSHTSVMSLPRSASQNMDKEPLARP